MVGLQVSTIEFTWRGKKYYVSKKTEHIVLPNRTVIKPKWFRDPIGFAHAKEVCHHFQHASLGEIAEHVGNAAFAHEA